MSVQASNEISNLVEFPNMHADVKLPKAHKTLYEPVIRSWLCGCMQLMRQVNKAKYIFCSSFPPGRSACPQRTRDRL